MDLFLLGGRVALAAVFALAAVGKLTDARSSALVRSAAGAELLLAAGLLANGTARYATGAALVVLGTGAAWKLARSRRTPCRCFGRWSRAALARHAVARNASLAVVAGLVVGRGPTTSPALVDWCVVGGVGTVLALGLVAVGYGRRRAARRLVARMVR